MIILECCNGMLLRLPFDSSRQISSGLALLLIIVLSGAVGWLAVSASQDIIWNIKQSSLTHLEERPGFAETKTNR